MNRSIGIDLGASHVGIGLVNTDSGMLLDKRYYLFYEKTDKEQLLQIIQIQINKILEDNKLKIENILKIGIGLNGGCDIKKGIFYGSQYFMLDIMEFPICEELKQIYPVDIYIEHDANCAIYAEAKWGSYRNIKEGLLCTIGTGVGWAYFSRKDGEFHMMSEIEKEKISSLNNGKYIRSFKKLALWYQELLGQENVSRDAIFHDVKQKNKESITLLNKYIDLMAEGIIKVCELCHTNYFCIGGGLSEHSECFLENLKSKLPSKIHIMSADFCNDAGIIGSGLLPFNVF